MSVYSPNLPRLPRFAKKGGAEIAEKPCPWRGEMINPKTGRLAIMYCEIGPEGHPGPHIGKRSREEFVRLLRAWRRSQRLHVPTEGEK